MVDRSASFFDQPNAPMLAAVSYRRDQPAMVGSAMMTELATQLRSRDDSRHAFEDDAG